MLYKYVITGMIIGALALLPMTSFAQQRFFSALPDVPLAPSFIELTDSIVVFDKVEGRLIDSSASSASLDSCVNAERFYHKALPALGWIKVTEGYLRDAEILTLTYDQTASDFCLLTLSARPQ